MGMEFYHLDIGLLEARALTYKIISQGFIKQANAEFMEIICRDKLFESFPLELNSVGFQQGLSHMRLWCSRINDEEIDHLLTELKADYNQLFVGPNSLLAPPWESVYLTEEGLTFDRITLDVREFYRRHGLEFILINKEPDDHFAVELEFMAELIYRQIQCINSKQFEESSFLMKEQTAFLNLHLIKWTSLFTQSVIEGSQTSYYKALAYLAQDFIGWDYEHLSKEKLEKLYG